MTPGFLVLYYWYTHIFACSYILFIRNSVVCIETEVIYSGINHIIMCQSEQRSRCDIEIDEHSCLRPYHLFIGKSAPEDMIDLTNSSDDEVVARRPPPKTNQAKAQVY